MGISEQLHIVDSPPIKDLSYCTGGEKVYKAHAQHRRLQAIANGTDTNYTTASASSTRDLPQVAMIRPFPGFWTHVKADGEAQLLPCESAFACGGNFASYDSDQSGKLSQTELLSTTAWSTYANYKRDGSNLSTADAEWLIQNCDTLDDQQKSDGQIDSIEFVRANCIVAFSLIADPGALGQVGNQSSPPAAICGGNFTGFMCSRCIEENVKVAGQCRFCPGFDYFMLFTQLVSMLGTALLLPDKWTKRTFTADEIGQIWDKETWDKKRGQAADEADIKTVRRMLTMLRVLTTHRADTRSVPSSTIVLEDEELLEWYSDPVDKMHASSTPRKTVAKANFLRHHKKKTQTASMGILIFFVQVGVKL
eukprot:SAG11_NODE_5330_length_1594_cov_1.137793_2_plen_365_part_00